MSIHTLKRTGVFLGILAAVTIGGTAAVALVIGAGGTQFRVDVRSEVGASNSNSTVFVDVPGANVVVSVPGGTNRLFIARYTAESRCFGGAAAPQAWCSLRIIATNIATGASRVFDPNSGLDYAFDTNPPGAPDDLWEGHAMERSVRLPAGTYRVRLQRAVTNAATFFWLDDWHLSIENDS
jgi:hypothetical protein